MPEREPGEAAAGDGGEAAGLQVRDEPGCGGRAERGPRRVGRRPGDEHGARRPLALAQPARERRRDGHGVARGAEHERARREAGRRDRRRRAPANGVDEAPRRHGAVEQAAHGERRPASALTSARSRAPSGPRGVTRTVTRRPRTRHAGAPRRPVIERRPRRRPSVAALKQRHRPRLGRAARRLLGRARRSATRHAEPHRQKQREQADDLDRRLPARRPHRCGANRDRAETEPTSSPKDDGTRTVTRAPPPASERTRAGRARAAGAAPTAPPPAARARPPRRAPPHARRPRPPTTRRRRARAARARRAAPRPAAAPPPARPLPALAARACTPASRGRCQGTRRECAARRARGARNSVLRVRLPHAEHAPRREPDQRRSRSARPARPRSTAATSPAIASSASATEP